MSEQENSGCNRGKHSLRELGRIVMRSPVGENAIKPLFILRNQEEDHRSPHAVSEVETLLHLETIPWPSKEEKELLLAMKIDQISGCFISTGLSWARPQPLGTIRIHANGFLDIVVIDICPILRLTINTPISEAGYYSEATANVA